MKHTENFSKLSVSYTKKIFQRKELEWNWKTFQLKNFNKHLGN